MRAGGEVCEIQRERVAWRRNITWPLRSQVRCLYLYPQITCFNLNDYQWSPPHGFCYGIYFKGIQNYVLWSRFRNAIYAPKVPVGAHSTHPLVQDKESITINTYRKVGVGRKKNPCSNTWVWEWIPYAMAVVQYVLITQASGNHKGSKLWHKNSIMYLGRNIWGLSVMLNLSGLLFQEEESVGMI